jgi:hypothetical protein
MKRISDEPLYISITTAALITITIVEHVIKIIDVAAGEYYWLVTWPKMKQNNN